MLVLLHRKSLIFFLKRRDDPRSLHRVMHRVIYYLLTVPNKLMYKEENTHVILEQCTHVFFCFRRKTNERTSKIQTKDSSIKA